MTTDPARAAALASDTESVRSVLGGAPLAFESLMRRYNQRVYRSVRPLSASDADAEDIAQEAWLLAYRNLAQWDGRASFATWLTRIAINYALRCRRSSRPLSLVDDAAVELQDTIDAPAPEAAVASAELRRLVEHAISTLPDTLKLVYVLRELEECSGPDVAETLGLTQEAVRVRLHRARATLRDRLEDALSIGTRGAFEFDGLRCDRIVAQVLARIG